MCLIIDNVLINRFFTLNLVSQGLGASSVQIGNKILSHFRPGVSQIRQRSGALFSARPDQGLKTIFSGTEVLGSQIRQLSGTRHPSSAFAQLESRDLSSNSGPNRVSCAQTWLQLVTHLQDLPVQPLAHLLQPQIRELDLPL